MRKLIFLLIAMTMACNEIRDCTLNPDVEYAVVGFFNSADSLEKEVIFNAVYNDQFLYYNELDTGVYFPLPLDPVKRSVTFFLETDSNTFDLTLDYRVRSIQLYSVDCGGGFSYDSLKSTTTNFDSVTVIGSTINKNILVNVEVYF
ncbi:MAG: hypothetical protein ACI8TA_002772 [Cyclobacteriaceae bacterium]|jgi:hypothetical protein